MSKYKAITLKVFPKVKENDFSIDHEELKKAWLREPNKWLLSQWDNDYRLIRNTYKGRVKDLSICIEIAVATKIIKNLGLRKLKSGIFKRGATWKLYDK